MIKSYLILSLLMVFNGIFFAPPSEYLYFDAVMAFKQQYTAKYFLLPLGNTFGHILFFLAIRFINNFIASSKIIIRSRHIKYGNILRIFVKLFRKLENYSHDYFRQYGNKYYSVMFGRLVPCVHTAICIPAALSNITITRYSLLTLFGNLIYSSVCLSIILITPSGDSYKENLLNAVYIFGILYVLHMVHYAKIKSNLKTQN